MGEKPDLNAKWGKKKCFSFWWELWSSDEQLQRTPADCRGQWFKCRLHARGFFFLSMLDGSWKWSQPNVHKLIFKRRDQISMGPRTFTQSEIDPIQNPNSSKPRENTNTESSDGWKEQQHTVIFLCTAQVKLSVTLFECLCKSTLLLIVNVTIL